jgi:hypothetical protein
MAKTSSLAPQSPTKRQKRCSLVAGKQSSRTYEPWRNQSKRKTNLVISYLTQALYQRNDLGKK